MKRQMIITFGAMLAINLATPLAPTQASNISGHLTAHQANLVGHTKVTKKQYIDNTLAASAPMESMVARHQGNQISYYIASTGIARVAYQHAVNNWNHLGVIKLVPTTQANATIVLSDTTQMAGDKGLQNGDDDGNTDYDVTTGMSTCIINAQQSHPTYYDEQSASPKRYTQLDATATHELGHALGFAHDDGTTNYHVREIKYTYRDGKFHARRLVANMSRQQVMNSGLKLGLSYARQHWSADSMPYEPLGQRQINALREHYGL